MGTRQSRLLQSRREADARVRSLVAELVQTRVGGGISQRQLAEAVGCSQSEISRLERLVRPETVSVARLFVVAAALGLRASITLHPAGQPIRDQGHQALIGRLRRLLAPAWSMTLEAPFPNVGDLRTWDLLLRVDGQRIGVECETRIRDIQALARRIHQRERDGGADVVLLVLIDSSANRQLLPDLLTSLGASFDRSPRQVLAALRHGVPLSGPAVLCI